MKFVRPLLLTAIAIALIALPGAAQVDEPSVSGRIVLPEGATLDGAIAWTVELQDTSLADAPATTISAAGGAIEDPAATSIDYAVGYDPASIDESATYTLSARIVSGTGDLLFITDTAIPVITSAAPVEGVDVAVIAVEAAAAGGEPRVIEFEATATLTFAQNGVPITEIPVTPGETVLFRIDNTAFFAHNFYIGADEILAMPNGTTDVGIPDWTSGVQELEWVVPDDLTGIRFACTVPGHYFLMQGDFTIAP